MEIEVELTEQDHIDFYIAYGLKRNWIGKAIALLLIDLILCSLVGISSNAFLLLLIIFTGILYSFFFYIPYLKTKQRLRAAYVRDLSSLLKKHYKPFATGIEIIEGSTSSFIRYEGIKQFGRTGQFTYIILFDGRYYILPDWCFSSYPEIGHFLRIVRTGIVNVQGAANIKGAAAKTPLTFKPMYLVGILCLVPLLGAFAGIVLIILGLAHYKDRVFVIMGVIGVAITVTIYGSLILFTFNSGTVKNGFAELTQTQINDLVKTIEFYKVQNGEYPDSLQQLDTKGGSFVSIYDTMSSDLKAGSKEIPYQYHKLGNKYLLFSVGVDGKPNTKDDIYPNLRVTDTSKVGFIRKPVH